MPPLFTFLLLHIGDFFTTCIEFHICLLFRKLSMEQDEDSNIDNIVFFIVFNLRPIFEIMVHLHLGWATSCCEDLSLIARVPPQPPPMIVHVLVYCGDESFPCVSPESLPLSLVDQAHRFWLAYASLPQWEEVPSSLFFQDPSGRRAG